MIVFNFKILIPVEHANPVFVVLRDLVYLHLLHYHRYDFDVYCYYYYYYPQPLRSTHLKCS